MEASEVRTVIHKLPGPQRLLHSLYDCDYQEFFPGFLNVAALLEADMFLASHVRYFMREARAVVYAQYLASYKSVTIVAMAKAFGVSPAFLDEEVRFLFSIAMTCRLMQVESSREPSLPRGAGVVV